MTPKVVSVTKKYMKNSLEIAVARVNRAADNVQHLFYMVQAKERYEVVKRIADMNPIIFGKKVKKLYPLLWILLILQDLLKVPLKERV